MIKMHGERVRIVVYYFTAADIAQPVKLANPVASNIMGTTGKSREKYVCGPH
jgi:hypothetical protein